MNILLIEDYDDHAMLVSYAIGTSHHVDRACTLAEASDSLEASDYDVVLCDLSLPDGVGVNNVRYIREHSPTIPLIVLTCLDDEEMAKEALEIGAQDYLIKSEVMLNSRTAASALSRSVLYATQRQISVRQTERLVKELKDSQLLLKEKNERLAELCTTAQRFVDTVSHEFRTPLTVIKEYSSLIREGVVGETNLRQQEMLSVLEDRADDLNTMVDDMLDVSRLESGLLGVIRGEATVGEIVTRVESSLRRKADVHEVGLTISIPDDLPNVWCDAEKAGRVLINLVVNAIKFSGEPGAVNVAARHNPTADEVVISVADNGPGISAENKQMIFDRFTQPITSVRQSTKGFGLGLAIAKELVDLNLGQMTVESEEGCGSTFSFSLPLAQPAELLKRHLTRCHATASESHIHLVEVSLASEADDRDLRDLQMIIAQHLKTRDLLFPAGEGVWVAVIVTPDCEYALFEEALEGKRVKAGRNRPKGKLPEFTIKRKLTSQLEDCDAVALAEELEASLNPQAEVCLV